jgi:hypothetical protein
LIPAGRWRYAHAVFRSVLVLSLLLSACQTYRNDLNRGQRYYEENQYAQALAVWRALELDVDSLSEAEQARYAYFRGMTDYRLARVEGANDDRFDQHARYWLGIASAIETDHPGGLKEHEKTRLQETLTELNNKVYGLDSSFVPGSEAPAETAPAAAAPEEQSNAPAAPAGPAQSGGACQQTTQCPADHICEGGVCVKL